jgi:hypothetical protein
LRTQMSDSSAQQAAAGGGGREQLALKSRLVTKDDFPWALPLLPAPAPEGDATPGGAHEQQQQQQQQQLSLVGGVDIRYTTTSPVYTRYLGFSGMRTICCCSQAVTAVAVSPAPFHQQLCQERSRECMCLAGHPILSRAQGIAAAASSPPAAEEEWKKKWRGCGVLCGNTMWSPVPLVGGVTGYVGSGTYGAVGFALRSGLPGLSRGAPSPAALRAASSRAASPLASGTCSGAVRIIPNPYGTLGVRLTARSLVLSQLAGRQVVFVDGNGVLHPRGFGLASHLGVLTDIPTVLRISIFLFLPFRLSPAA